MASAAVHADSGLPERLPPDRRLDGSGAGRDDRAGAGADSVRVAAAQGGGTTYILDVLINGVSIWTNPNDRPILSGVTAGRFISGRINRSAVQVGDIIELIIAQAGNKSRLVATVALEDPSARPP